jgi:rhamnosyltransferase subunit B
MCELYGLPLARIILTPALIYSLEAPPMPWRAPANGPLGKSFRRHLLPRLYAERERDAYRLNKVNAHRVALGLSCLRSFDEPERLVQLRCAFFPDWYAPRAGDWPELEQVGFPLPPSRGELPRAVTRRIETQGPPLVFTPGTGASDVTQFFAEAQRCCALLDRPGVFLSQLYTGERGAVDGRMVGLDYVDLGLLLPHAALLVHHGGIGTTARALQAGIPQIICPHGYDQPDNGARVCDLGVGAVVERSRSSGSDGESLATTARRLLASERVAAALRNCASRLSQSSALTRAADLLLARFATAAS